MCCSFRVRLACCFAGLGSLIGGWRGWRLERDETGYGQVLVVVVVVVLVKGTLLVNWLAYYWAN